MILPRKIVWNNSGLWLFLLAVLLFSCQSINQNRTELGIPQSVVYLSFDDGPNAYGDTTARLLDVLKKYHVRATFCLLGENAEKNPGLVRRIYDEGHIIINHGYSDNWAYRMDEDEFRDNLARGEKAISGALGFDMNPKLYRPQGGFYTHEQEEILKETGYTLVPVTIRVYDAVTDGKKQSEVVRKVIDKTVKEGGGIILLHDARDSQSGMELELAKNPDGPFNRSWIPGAVEEIIAALLERGFQFKMVPESL